MLVLAAGTPYVWMANPLSALPTPYAVEAAGRSWYGNCIWDALGVVAILGGDGAVSSWCPDCGQRLSVEVEAGRLAPGEGVVRYAVPAARWWDSIGFICANMLLFRSEEHARSCYDNRERRLGPS